MGGTDEQLLADLLLRWEELRERGQDTPAGELCRGHPRLTDELARRIDSLKVMSWMDLPLAAGDDAPGIVSPAAEPRTLVGRYRLDHLIAEGGFAQVWRGYDLELQRAVAVKVPRPGRLRSAEAFTAEARRVARLKHPGIVPVFDVGRDGDLCFIVSEFVEGGSLGDRLASGPPPPPQAVRWVVEVAEALEYAHGHGVVHRDVKPGNILIDHHGRALLADFGIAQSASQAGQQALSLGTLRYMAPEQLEGKAADPRADIFSLGVVLHEALTGSLPYSSADPNGLRREIAAGAVRPFAGAAGLPAGLVRSVRRALEPDPAARHATAAGFAADLRAHSDRRVPTRRAWGGVALLVPLVAVLVAWAAGRPHGPGDPGPAAGAGDDHRPLAERVLRRGGAVTLHGRVGAVTRPADLPPGPARLAGVTLTGGAADDDLFLAVVAVPTLEDLALADLPALPGSFPAVAGAAHLRSVRVSGTPVTEADAGVIARLPLEALELRRCGLTDRAAAAFAGTATLRAVNLTGNPLTDDGVGWLAGLPALRELRLNDTRLTDRGTAALARLAGLRVLELRGTGITDAGAAALAPLGRLENLNLSGTAIRRPDRLPWHQWAAVEQVHLNHLRVDGPPDLAWVSRLPRLRVLEVRGMGVTASDAGRVMRDRPLCRVLP